PHISAVANGCFSTKSALRCRSPQLARMMASGRSQQLLFVKREPVLAGAENDSKGGLYVPAAVRKG
ncbi:hypothetical protein, partial [Aliiruegeria sabulilitoris]|uniref:hypothetical protein n=1 Tax=Aliiruegeria sabulilitoris TaxID=1510458 RepID=UPI001E309DD5